MLGALPIKFEIPLCPLVFLIYLIFKEALAFYFPIKRKMLCWYICQYSLGNISESASKEVESGYEYVSSSALESGISMVVENSSHHGLGAYVD